MSEEEKIDPGHGAVRGVLRLAGPVLIGIGGLCMVIAFVDFFSSVNSSGPPKLFFLFFIGVPILFAGLVTTSAGFAGRIARYQAGEAAPVVKDTFHYMVEGTKDDVKTVTQPVRCGAG